MSFRRRLTLFFVVIVIVPMIAIAVVLFRLIAQSTSGKADAALAALSHTATTVYRNAATDPVTATVADHVSLDPQLTAALASDNRAAAQRRVAALVSYYGLQRLAITRGSLLFADAGNNSAVAVVQRNLTGTNGVPLGELQLSALTAPDYATQVHSLTGLGIVVRTGTTPLADTLAAAPMPARTPQQLHVGGRTYRGVAFLAPGFGAQQVAVGLFYDETSLATATARDRDLAAILLAALCILALVLAVGISRSLQLEISGFLAAARRVAGGDFDAEVPIDGDDEFAELGREFNKMSQQLRTRVDELGEQRRLLEGTLRRVGETFASSLDRDALLEIVLRTVVDGVSADSGRAFVVEVDSRGQLPVASIGEGPDVRALAEVEAATRSSGRPEQIERNGVSALGHPLAADGGSGRPAGVISVSRNSRPFDAAEREMFAYLASQAAISIGNVDLHERIKEQAITDELTGLFNRRHFEAVLGDELRRVQRFGHSVALVLIDVDDFKRVNDLHGHQQGDAALGEVARVVRSCARDIDCAARYGGEELAVVLAETDARGAMRFAERVRSAIEQLRIAPVGGRSGPAVTLTASIGVAAAPQSGTAADKLVTAADDALYRAKRAGKNRVVRA